MVRFAQAFGGATKLPLIPLLRKGEVGRPACIAKHRTVLRRSLEPVYAFVSFACGDIMWPRAV